MTKRLQVILQDPDDREIQRAARLRHLSLAAWVRQALESARRQEPAGSESKKLDAVRSAVPIEFPAGEMEDMLKQIGAGLPS